MQRPRPRVFPAFCAMKHDEKAKRIPPSLLFWQARFPSLLLCFFFLRSVRPSTFSPPPAAFIPLFCRLVVGKCMGKNGLRREGRKEGRREQGGSPQSLFAVRKRCRRRRRRRRHSGGAGVWCARNNGNPFVTLIALLSLFPSP